MTPFDAAVDAVRAEVMAEKRAIRDRMTPATVAPMSKGSPKEIVRLPEPVRDALAEQAQAEGVSKSEIMRRAIVRELGMESASDG